GVGVIKAGWHCGSQPGGSGCAYNAECQKCTGNCNLVNDDTLKPSQKCATCKDGKTVPPPTDAECCTQPDIANDADYQAGKLLGTVACCRGSAILCMYPGNFTSRGNVLGDSIAKECVAVHEGTHKDHIDCSDGDCKTWEGFKPSVTQSQGECDASKAEKQCLENKRPSCNLSPDPAACQAVVDHWIQEAINYGNSFFTSPSTCF
ncbi:hypothetical protein, partial [Methylobacter sp.]|uniref:hypothetical protein n=1 Tax=Methylobacter sp. TaxID=2051955 RepID=UPI0025D95246